MSLINFTFTYQQEECSRAQRSNLPRLPIAEEKWQDFDEYFDEQKLIQEEMDTITLPEINPAKNQLAYGSGAMPKLNRELRGKNVTVKHTALMQLCDYLYDPENIDRVKKDEVISILRVMLTEKDKLVRIKAAECLSIIASYGPGIDILLHSNVIINLAKLFDDYSIITRVNCHKTFARLSINSQGARAILQNQLMEKFLEKLLHERNFIQSIILETVYNCLQQDHRHALDSNAMKIFKILLNNAHPTIRAKAALAISELSVSLAGKIAACSSNVVYPLICLLDDSDALVRAKAAAALMLITITTTGKTIALENAVVDAATPLLNDKKFEIRLNVLKLLTNISESPQGRALLQDYIPKISKLLEDPDPSIREAAQIALKVIKWKHTDSDSWMESETKISC